MVNKNDLDSVLRCGRAPQTRGWIRNSHGTFANIDKKITKLDSIVNSGLWSSIDFASDDLFLNVSVEPQGAFIKFDGVTFVKRDRSDESL